MALSPRLDAAPPASGEVSRPPDHGFHELRVAEVVPETADASTLVLEVPASLSDRYRYEPGQFLTFRCRIDGGSHLRSYSMSSAPGRDEPLQVTIKRVAGGLVSNWMLDSVAAGDVVEATRPAGVFGRRQTDGDVLAVAGGSGITPVLSVLKCVLATSSSRARLFYANRDPASVIFAGVLDELAARHRGRLEVLHHHDSEAGLVDIDELAAVVGDCSGTDCYVCGPAPFMELAEEVVLAGGAEPDAVHIERFTPADFTPADFTTPDGAPTDITAAPGTAMDSGRAASSSGDAPHPARVTIELDGRVEAADHRPGTTVLQTARQAGLSPPFSCEAGNCATCMARLLEGQVRMRANNALSDDEVRDGWILTCQSEPTTDSVRVLYGWDEG